MRSHFLPFALGALKKVKAGQKSAIPYPHFPLFSYLCSLKRCIY
jgi:hypothetical protein